MQASSSDDFLRLSTELERALLRALRYAYDDANHSFFKNLLRPPIFALTDATARLGRWIGAERTLELARPLLTEQPWGVVIEVLKHEMAHQFVDEVLRLSDEVAHGPAFRQVCEERGIDPSATGMPRAVSTSSGDHRLIDRITKLLALAESPNVHEAQAAMGAAQRLMLKHNIESITRRSGASYSFRYLGVPSGRINEYERILAAILTDHFFVECIWVPVWRALAGKRGSQLEICGTPENLELAEYVHQFLLHTSEKLWKEYRKKHGIRRNAERRTFLSGVMSGFREKLVRQKAAHREEGLVWVGDGDLERYFRLRHPRVRWARYASGSRSDAFGHGREAGGRIVIHKGMRQGGSAASSGPTRMLPPSRRV